MLDITLAAFGSLKNKAFAAAVADYRQRLKPYMRLQELTLETEAFSASNKAAAQKKEEERLEKFLAKYDKADVILLDEGSEELDSLGFAKRLGAFDGRKLVLVVGAALGFAKNLKVRYHCLSLSKLTMPHELARVVLFEQLYRAATLLKGKEYHY